MKTKTPKTPEPLRGKELLRAAVNKIINDPDKWNQRLWHCGTSHCIGGWCQVLAGVPETERAEDIVPLIGLIDADAGYLFSADRLLPEIHAFAKCFIEGKDFFNRDGFNRAGFDRDGFNRAGFDRDGFNRNGFSRDGFSRAGFDRDGFSRDGFNRAGFDRAGFDRDGFNRDGFSRDGFNRAGKKLPLL